jgi:hypothetical protein
LPSASLKNWTVALLKLSPSSRYNQIVDVASYLRQLLHSVSNWTMNGASHGRHHDHDSVRFNAVRGPRTRHLRYRTLKKDVALEELAQWLEDQADIMIAKEVLARNEPTISIAEVR